VKHDIRAGKITTAMQLFVRNSILEGGGGTGSSPTSATTPRRKGTTSTGSKQDSSKTMKTLLVVKDGCLDACWLEHTPDRFVALLKYGYEV
jgi:hypothetical protein